MDLYYWSKHVFVEGRCVGMGQDTVLEAWIVRLGKVLQGHLVRCCPTVLLTMLSVLCFKKVGTLLLLFFWFFLRTSFPSRVVPPFKDLGKNLFLAIMLTCVCIFSRAETPTKCPTCQSQSLWIQFLDKLAQRNSQELELLSFYGVCPSFATFLREGDKMR